MKARLKPSVMLVCGATLLLALCGCKNECQKITEKKILQCFQKACAGKSSCAACTPGRRLARKKEYVELSNECAANFKKVLKRANDEPGCAGVVVFCEAEKGDELVVGSEADVEERQEELAQEKKERRKKQVAAFYKKFRAIDDGEIAAFWRCTVRARHRDVRLARDTLEITDGLTRARSNFPTSQPDHIKDRCLPMITGIVGQLEKLETSEGFKKPVAAVTRSMQTVRKAFTAYASRIDGRKKITASEQEVGKCGAAFHAAYDGEITDDVLAYWNILNCAIPDLPAAVRKVKKGPNTQHIVEYVYNNCVKKGVDALPLADKIRKECFHKRKTLTNKKDKGFKEGVRYLSGDSRDRLAISACFKKANGGFDGKELKAVALAFVSYRAARGLVLEQLAKVVKEIEGKDVRAALVPPPPAMTTGDATDNQPPDPAPKAAPGAGRGQIILTTHSPRLLDHFSADQIRAVVLQGFQTRVGSVSREQREAIKEQLLDPGELLTVDPARIDESEPGQ